MYCFKLNAVIKMTIELDNLYYLYISVTINLIAKLVYLMI